MTEKVLFFVLLIIAGIQGNAQSSNLEAYWDDGLKFRSKDGAYKFSVGGRVHYDVAFLDHSGELDTLFGKTADKTEVRRARLSFEGTINKAIAYEFEFSFGESIEFADLSFSFLRVPYFERLTVGHFREPFGLEELTSSNAIVFMERSLTSAFGPSRNTGLMVQKPFREEKIRVYAGAFRITNDLGSDLMGEGKHSFSGRLAFNPVFDTANNKAIHLGAAVNTFTPVQRTYQVKTENEVHTAPAYINSGKIENVKRVSQVGGEFGITKDRLFIQSEYIHSFARLLQAEAASVNKNHQFNSFYTLISYFLKGGKRVYNRSGNRFSSLSLTERYEQGSMSGAWELGLRFSRINLLSTPNPIKNMSDVTLGLNWYFNSNSRIMMNYILTRINAQYSANALQFRIQVTF